MKTTKRCFCNQPPPSTCGNLWHHDKEPSVTIRAGTHVRQLQRDWNEPMHYFTNYNCDETNPHLCTAFDLVKASVEKGKSSEVSNIYQCSKF